MADEFDYLLHFHPRRRSLNFPEAGCLHFQSRGDRLKSEPEQSPSGKRLTVGDLFRANRAMPDGSQGNCVGARRCGEQPTRKNADHTESEPDTAVMRTEPAGF